MKVKKQKPPKTKLSVKERVSVAVFMEAVPSLINLWESKETGLSFDKWLRNIYDEHKNKQKNKNERS